jgi:hypothetical protein
LRTIEKINVPLKLKEQGISEIKKEGKTIVIVFKDIPIRFDIQKSWIKTVKGFEAAAKPHIQNDQLVQRIILELNVNYMNIINFNKKLEEPLPVTEPNLEAAEVKHQDLEARTANRDYAESVIKTAKRTVKQEDSLIRQILYCGMSTYTNDPINLGIVAPTSEGKTYPVIEVMNFFPKEDIWYVGSMSPKVLIRQQGVLVDNNNEPIDYKIKELRLVLAETEDHTEKENIKQQLRILFENSKTLIELTGKVIVFLEPPHSEVWNLLKPILSHDAAEIEYPYVDKNERDGIITKNVVVRGWPACIFCSAKDESRWPTWPEIVSRFLISSPNMIAEKYQESNMLIAQTKGLPSLIQELVIVSSEDIDLAKQSIIYLKQELQRYLKAAGKSNGVWIPYGPILSEALPAERGTDTRTVKRVFSLLNIIPLLKAHLRPKIVIKGQTNIIATLDDLSEVLSITQNLNGIPVYKMKFFREILYPLYKSKTEPNHTADNSKRENIIAVTTAELREEFNAKTGKTLNSDNLKKTYLFELLNNGLLDEEDSVIDKRQKIYYPLVFPEEPNQLSNNRNFEDSDKLLHYSAILLPRNCKSIPENWLVLEILGFLKYRISLDDIKLFDKDENKVTIAEFVSKYEETKTLTRYFSKTKLHNYTSKIFGEMHVLEQTADLPTEELTNSSQFLQFDIRNPVSKVNISD